MGIRMMEQVGSCAECGRSFAELAVDRSHGDEDRCEDCVNAHRQHHRAVAASTAIYYEGADDVTTSARVRPE